MHVVSRLAIIVLTVAGLSATAAEASNRKPVFEAVSLSAASFNPTLGDTVRITANLARPGTLTVLIVDRDGFPVRALARAATVSEGVSVHVWDGRDDHGHLVADEAYSLSMEWSDGSSAEAYFPADAPSRLTALEAEYYAARTATLVYRLPVASRVHIQAGVAVRNPRNGEMEGPVMKTIVNREPRSAGKIAEHWNGFDESGTLNVADMRDFVLAIAATPLPENSVITYGNRESTFAEAAVDRTGRSLFTHRNSAGAHHEGLAVLEDISPRMIVEPLDATWSETDRAWHVGGPNLRVRISLAGPSALAFAREPGQLYRFVDGKLTSKTRRPAAGGTEVRVPLNGGSRSQIVTFNWRSDLGAVAANSLRVMRTGAPPAAQEQKGVRP